MCGIVGYTGPREAGPILIEGLKRLEYRGYDSAGIALVDDTGAMFVEKRAGKLVNLQTAIADRTPHAAIGLAHTRWATHGRPNDLNAHPHRDCTGEITVIHNGIIENFRELRDGLEARGHTLTSETDTEAIAHLVEEAYRGDLADAVRDALTRLEGAYAIVVMHVGEGDRLVGARKDVPLVVGLGNGESFLASDVAAVLAHTDQIVFLEDGDVADIRPWGVTITDVAGVPVQRPVTTIDWTPEAAEKGGYEHFMLKEIHEQPESLSQAIAGRIDRDDRIAVDQLVGLESTLKTVTRIELIACGSAYYAALIGAAALQDWTGLPARATVGSEFRYSPPPLDEHTLVIAVTQSGETADTIAPTRLARERGCPIIAVTNTVGSAITREAAAVLFLQAGPEVAVAASKTFVTQVTTLVILAAAIAKARGSLPEAEEVALGAALRALPSASARALASAAVHDAGAGPPLRQFARVHVRRPRADLPGGARGCAEAQGGQLRPCRGLRRGRAQARADLPAGRRMSARRRGDPLEGLRQADQQRHGGPGPRRQGDRGRDRGRRSDRALRRRHLLGARHPRGAQPGAGDHPAPAVRLSHRRRAGHGRRPAAQPGQVGHGRVGAVEVPVGTTELGIDIIKVDRIRAALDKFGARFSNRVLTESERRYVRDRPETMAGRWAAKEAVSKVLGLGVRGIGWRDIEIERMPTGQPAVRLHGRAAARAEQLGMERIAVSITHESDYAVAIAFGVRTAGGRYVFPPDIEDRLDERERRILARIERLRSVAVAGGADALASDAPQPREPERPRA